MIGHWAQISQYVEKSQQGLLITKYTERKTTFISLKNVSCTAKTMYFTYTPSNHERCVGHISIVETVFNFYPMQQENIININCFKHGLNNFDNFDKYK